MRPIEKPVYGVPPTQGLYFERVFLLVGFISKHIASFAFFSRIMRSFTRSKFLRVLPRFPPGIPQLVEKVFTQAQAFFTSFY